MQRSPEMRNHAKNLVASNVYAVFAAAIFPTAQAPGPNPPPKAWTCPRGATRAHCSHSARGAGHSPKTAPVRRVHVRLPCCPVGAWRHCPRVARRFEPSRQAPPHRCRLRRTSAAPAPFHEDAPGPPLPCCPVGRRQRRAHVRPRRRAASMRNLSHPNTSLGACAVGNIAAAKTA